MFKRLKFSLTQQEEHEEYLQPEVTATAAVHNNARCNGDHCQSQILHRLAAEKVTIKDLNLFQKSAYQYTYKPYAVPS